MRENKGIFENMDWVLVLLYAGLVLMGWLNIYAAVYNEENNSLLNLEANQGKQLLFIGGAALIVMITLSIDGRLYERLAWPIYLMIMVLVAGVLVAGDVVNGAKSWYSIGGFRLQPSELAKFATCLGLAKYLSNPNHNLKYWLHRIAAIGVLLLPAAIILPQPDPGSSLVFLSLVLVLFREGLPAYFLFILFGSAVIFLLALLVPQTTLVVVILVGAALVYWLGRRQKYWLIKTLTVAALAIGFSQTVDYAFNNILEDRHRNRINILLGKANDPKGIGYNTAQSMIAIGSGGFSGKGYLQGTQTKFNFVPEQHTDFIFCTVGEEWGFLGSTVVLVLFIALLWRIVVVAERQKSPFGRIYGYGVASILFLHFSVNIAMTIGLFPVVGIPLPFFSYGGSSLWGFTVLLFIFVRLDSYRMQIL